MTCDSAPHRNGDGIYFATTNSTAITNNNTTTLCISPSSQYKPLSSLFYAEGSPSPKNEGRMKNLMFELESKYFLQEETQKAQKETPAQSNGRAP
jgi:hypothetical protein